MSTTLNCPECQNSFPVIAELIPQNNKFVLAKHCCRECLQPLFEIKLVPGMQVIATEDIHNLMQDYTIPKGRMLRISAFTELPQNAVGFLFAGLFGAGSFQSIGFSAKWDIVEIINQQDTAGTT